jgi:hypothetical protein
MVDTTACFHPNQTSWEIHEEFRQLVSAHLLFDDNLPSLIHAVHLEEILRQIDAYSSNLHVGRSFCSSG